MIYVSKLVVVNSELRVKILIILNFYAFYYRVPLASNDIKEHLKKLLTKKGASFKTSGAIYLLEDIIRDCYLAPFGQYKDLEESKENEEKYKTYTMPDSSTIQIEHERFICPEILFNPKVGGLKSNGIHKYVIDSIAKCDSEIRNSLFKHVVLGGGTTLLEGFVDRFNSEIQELALPESKIKVLAPPERKYSSWIGGSINASLSSFQDKWIERSQYDEFGPFIINP